MPTDAGQLLLQLLQNAVVAVAFYVGWLNERTERQKRTDQLIEISTDAVTKNTEAMNRLSDAVDRLTYGGIPPRAQPPTAVKTDAIPNGQ